VLLLLKVVISYCFFFSVWVLCSLRLLKNEFDAFVLTLAVFICFVQAQQCCTASSNHLSLASLASRTQSCLAWGLALMHAESLRWSARSERNIIGIWFWFTISCTLDGFSLSCGLLAAWVACMFQCCWFSCKRVSLRAWSTNGVLFCRNVDCRGNNVLLHFLSSLLQFDQLPQFLTC